MPTDSRRLLIVDEEPTLLDSVTDLLITEGYLVMPAANAREVPAFADKLPVDLAVLDLDVLAENSRMIFKRLTRDHPHVPVNFAAARSNHLPAEPGDAAGVLLKKPIQSSSLTLPGRAGKGPPMSRKLRVEYPGTEYDVMNRGDQREDNFKADGDRQKSLFTLGEACGKTEWEVQAYCLTRNPGLTTARSVKQPACRVPSRL